MLSNNLFLRIIKGTNPTLLNISVLLMRCTIGILLFVAGSGKLLGWFGGYGITATLQGYVKMGFSAPWAYLSMFTEFFGGLLLVIGLLTRPAAFAIMINMLVATIVSLPGGFMGPTGAQTPFIFLIIDIAILIAGPMGFSLDAIVFRKSEHQT
jgi:putative oxidoreductase